MVEGFNASPTAEFQVPKSMFAKGQNFKNMATMNIKEPENQFYTYKKIPEDYPPKEPEEMGPLNNSTFDSSWINDIMI